MSRSFPVKALYVQRPDTRATVLTSRKTGKRIAVRRIL